MPISIKNPEHYQWGTNSEGWHLVKTPEISIIQERMPPGASEKTHRHLRSRQFFFVLSGTATMEHGDVTSTIHKGEGLEIDPRVVHRISNREIRPLEILVTSIPPSHGDREELN